MVLTGLSVECPFYDYLVKALGLAAVHLSPCAQLYMLLPGVCLLCVRLLCMRCL